jgi:pimeloyl-ACP methyl ester carboxylesterase
MEGINHATNAVYMAAGGIIALLGLTVVLGQVLGLPGVFLFLRNHRSAVGFVIGNFFGNLWYLCRGGGRLRQECIVLHESASAKHCVVIVPGTWSTIGYDWKRWNHHLTLLSQKNFYVVGLRWSAANSESGRAAAAASLKQWMEANAARFDTYSLIGHSYGGLVAALAASDPKVTGVVTIATPFISTEQLSNEHVAGSALAVFSRAIWLATLSLPINRAGHASARFVTVFAIYLFWVFARLIWADRAKPTWAPAIPLAVGQKLRSFQVKADSIVDQLHNAAQSDLLQPQTAPAFLKQSCLTRQAFSRWFGAFFVFCLIADMAAERWFPNLTSDVVQRALAGAVLYVLFVGVLGALAVWLKPLRELRDLSIAVVRLVSWDAITLDNRRYIISRLAGLNGYERWIRHIEISEAPPGATLTWTTLASNAKDVQAHTTSVEDYGVAVQVAAVLP